MHKFRDLKVWQKARLLVKDVYMITRNFPKEEQFGITNQIRRATVSISSNIAEGSGRRTTNDFRRFLDMANGSAFEVENLLILTSDLDYIQLNEFSELEKRILEIQKMLFGLMNKLN